jgi:hypothetical protein
MADRLLSSRLNIFPRSLAHLDGAEFGMAQIPSGNKLAVLASPGSTTLASFDGECSDFEHQTLMICPLNQRNAASLRASLAWLRPQLVGLRTSAGMGDRLGIATPGHVRALRQTTGKVMPIFAQQSIREMQRTRRTPQQVMDDAMWGIFEEGWQAGAGADADHLKTTQDIDACLEAGFTFFTLDPGQFVDDLVDDLEPGNLRSQLDQLPANLSPAATGLLGRTIDLEGYRVYFDEAILLKAVIKYGRAIEQVVILFQHLQKASGSRPFEVEISMDETVHPTSPAEHVYISSELHRLGVSWVSFAPRFVGRFEKGVDYIGDLRAFENQLASHAAIARHYGPYKLSLHSGSDKFHIYPTFMQQTRGLAHLKTAGTSYLEALRTIATLDRELFEGIYTYACEHFESDKLSYHISAQLSKAPKPGEIDDWPGLLEQFDARQILHVTFGSVLTQQKENGSRLFYDRIMHLLLENRELYFEYLEKHFKRHLEPFSSHSK